MTVKIGAQLLTYGASWSDAMETGQLVDTLGYDYLWGHDHLYSTGGDPYQPFFEGWTTLMAWAMSTERVRLGLLVGANTFRNPGVVAKMAATIDHASGGRSILGLGAGNVEFENLAHGIDPGDTLGQRIDWFEEALEIVRGLLAGREVTHRSAKYQFDHVRHAPQPIQSPLPVVIGAAGETRGLRLVARHADIWQWFAGTDEVELFKHKDRVLREHCEVEERDESTIERMIGCKFVLRSSAEEAGRVADALIAVHKWPAPIRGDFWAGTPQQAADWLTPYVEAGAGSFSPQIGWPYDRETIERLVSEVKPLVDARTG